MAANTKIVASAAIANSFEWYNYALFGQLAVIIGQHYFPSENSSVALMQGFLLFAIGYIIRPIGGIIFGVIGDKFGRKKALTAAILCMAIPTVIIGLLPTYQQIGITATILLFIVRMLQGLSMGGALTGSVSFLIEHTTKSRRGYVGSFTMASICWGILLASIVIFVIKQCMTYEEFVTWGWRIPFLIGFLIIFAGVYINKYTEETPHFSKLKQKQKVAEAPLKQVLTHNKKDILISIMINATGSIIFYMQAIYLMNYLKIERNFDNNLVDIMVNFSYIFTSIMILIAGRLSDKIGRKNIYVINLITIIISFPLITSYFETGDLKQVMIGLIAISMFSAFYIGPEPALQTEFYPSKIRNTALSVAYNIATSLFGGTTPYILGFLFLKSGNLQLSVFYVIISAIFSLIALYFYKDRTKYDKWETL